MQTAHSHNRFLFYFFLPAHNKSSHFAKNSNFSLDNTCVNIYILLIAADLLRGNAEQITPRSPEQIDIRLHNEMAVFRISVVLHDIDVYIKMITFPS